ncbi:MAG TPA: TadE family protein [Candidatus Limnocylindrales bacterium]|nr:TadE family protein [Thermoleophilia bacterium]HKY88970.1 TadE family protein [Candidatus Limnocylindrales bacterium]
MRSLEQRYRHHLRQASPGQALAEFALIAVILMLLFGTVLDLGRAFYANITIENAARAGALQAAKTPNSFTALACDYTTNKIGCAAINESRGSLVTITGTNIAATCEDMAGNGATCDDTPQPATRSRVTVTTTFDFLMPIFAVFFGGQTINLSATVAADQEKLPVAVLSSPSSSPSSSASASASASPSATPACPVNQTVVPDLANPAPETVAQARTEWNLIFSGAFIPSGQNTKIVTGQFSDAAKTIPLVPGGCYPLTSPVWVSHT